MKITIEVNGIDELESVREWLNSALPKTIAVAENKQYETIEDISISTRTSTCLKNGGIVTIKDLLALKDWELLKLPNFGKKSLRETKDRLRELGLRLGSV